MEYFKEHIEPTLPEISYFGAEFLDFATPFASECAQSLTVSSDPPARFLSLTVTGILLQLISHTGILIFHLKVQVNVENG